MQTNRHLQLECVVPLTFEIYFKSLWKSSGSDFRVIWRFSKDETCTGLRLLKPPNYTNNESIHRYINIIKFRIDMRAYSRYMYFF